MATTVLEFDLSGMTGLTLTADVHAIKSDTILAANKTCTEQTNRKGVYRFNVTENVTGVNVVRVKTSTATIAQFPTEVLVDDTGTYEASDRLTDLRAIVGVAQSAADLKDFADDGYDPVTNKVQGVVLVDANTDMRGTDSAALAITALSTATWTNTRAGYLDNLSAGAVALASAVSTIAADVWSVATRVLTAGTNIVLAKGTGITGFNDPAAATVAAAVEAAILDEGDATALLAAIAAKVEQFLVNEGDATATIAAIAVACNSAIVAGTVGTNVTAISTTIGVAGLGLSAIPKTGYKLASDGLDLTALSLAWADGGRLDLLIDAIKSITDGQGSTGTGLSAIPWNAAWDAEVQSEVVDALQETVPDSVPADGTRPSTQQAAYMVVQMLTDFAISGTTLTVRKPDGSTALMTFTLNDATNPTALTRAT